MFSSVTSAWGNVGNTGTSFETPWTYSQVVPPGQTVTAGPPANHTVLLTVSVLSAGAAQAGAGEQSLEYNAFS